MLHRTLPWCGGGREGPPDAADRQSEGVHELAEVIAFGFPLDSNPGPDKKEYPSISVKVCTASGAARKGGELERIDINGMMNLGPIGRAHGRSGRASHRGNCKRQPGIAEVIPSSLLSRVLEKPEVHFALPSPHAVLATNPSPSGRVDLGFSPPRNPSTWK